MGPVEVHNVLILWVVPVIRHEIRVIANGRKIAAAANAGKLKFGPAAFELARAIRSRDAQYIETDILAEPGLLRIGPLLREAEIGIHNEVRRERVGRAESRAVSVSVSVAGVTAAANRPSLSPCRLENCRREVLVMEKAEPPEKVEFLDDVPVHFAVNRIAVKAEAT